MQPLTLSFVQSETHWHDPAANRSQFANWFDAVPDDSQVIVLPEMCLTGYWHIRKLSREEIDALAEPVPSGPSSLVMADSIRSRQLSSSGGVSTNCGSSRSRNASNSWDEARCDASTKIWEGKLFEGGRMTKFTNASLAEVDSLAAEKGMQLVPPPGRRQ